MNKIKTTVIMAAVIACALPAMAQRKRVSPHETISADIDGGKITIVYGRPYTKNPRSGEPRKIWGELVPYGQAWRTGADEATLLTITQPIMMGSTTIPAGKYSLYTLPEQGSAKLIVNKQTGQWGTVYDEKQDLARIDMKEKKLDTPVDQFTMEIEKSSGGGGVLKLKWADREYSVPFTVQK
ncbi:conserved exported hypothetical protein [Verrucomicrobia bacterium]|nr:conserved exported hypothetical protein [Verrucomicrobiota bacterium]